MPDEIQEALELAAGSRLKAEYGAATTPTAHDLAHVRRVVNLFLESLDDDLTVSELRQHLS